ncbi:MAG: hypothetical protein DRN78_03405, partial [Thermoproteota archaeon]
IDHYEVRLDGGSWIDVGTATSYTFTNLAEGSHTVDVKAYDKAGNYDVTTVTFTVDITPPVLDITNPANETYTNSENVRVEWTYYDTLSGVDHVEVNLDGTSWINVGTATSYTFTNLTEATHIIYVRAFDVAGNVKTVKWVIYVDFTSPTVRITKPEDGAYLNTSQISVSWSPSDNFAVDYSLVQLDSGTPINVGSNTSYTFSGVGEGSHTITVIVYDKAGNYASASVSFTVDLTLPTVNITSPAEDYIASQNVLVEWSGSDNYGIDHYEIKLDDGSWINVGTTTSYEFTGLAEGSHTVSVKAVDVAKNVRITSKTFIVDVTAPVVTITTPTDGEYITSSSVTIIWTYTEDNLDRFEVTLDGVTWIDVGTATSYTFTGVSEGSYVAKVRAYDKAGNTVVDSVSFTVDYTPPQVWITQPEDEEYINKTEVTVTWNAVDNTGIKRYIIALNGSSIDVGVNTSYTYTNLAEGYYTFRVTAYDLAGNQATTSIVFYIDVTAPTVTIIYPTNGLQVNDSSVTIQWNITENLAVNGTKIYLNGTFKAFVQGSQTSYTISGLQDGVYTLTLITYDKAGNSGSDTIQFTVSIPISVWFTNPSDDEWVSSSTVELRWDYYNKSDIDYFWLRVWNSTDLIVNENITDPSQTSYTLSGLEDDYYTATIVAYTKDGYSDSNTIKFHIDTVPPIITLIDPQAGKTVYTSNVSYRILWTASDNFGIKYYRVYIDGSLYATVTDTQITVTFNVEGAHTILIRAIDYAGNYADAGGDTTIIFVDYTAPSVNITSPTHGSYFNETEITLVWEGADRGFFLAASGVDYYEVKIDDGSWINVGTNTSYTFSGLAEGYHTLYVRVFDKAGNYEVDSITIIIDMTPPTISILSPTEGEFINTSNVTIEWSGSDSLAGISEYFISTDGSTWISVGLNTSYTLTGLTTGSVIVYIKAFDKAGNAAIAQRSFNIDLIEPSITLHEPADESYYNSSTVTVKWNASDSESGIDYYEIKIDAGSWIDVGSTTQYNITGLAEGVHTVYVRAYDKAGNFNEISAIFYVDLSDPSVLIISPNSGVYVNDSTPLIKWTMDDNFGIGEVMIDYGSGWVNIGIVNQYELPEVADGSLTVYVMVIDYSGRKAVDSVTFYVDATAPDINLISPENNTYTSSTTITVSWNATDNLSGVDYFMVKLNNNEWNVTTATSITFSGLTEGVQYVYIRAYDKAGNSRTVLVKITVDTTAPSVTITSPSSGEYIGSSDVTITWSGDDNFDISYYKIQIDGGSWINVELSTSYTFTGLSEGSHDIIVKVVDKAGNSAISSTVSFIVDLTPPALVSINPTDGAHLNTTSITVEWSFLDNYVIDHYEVRLDGGSWIDVGTATSYTFTNLAEGSHTVDVKA